MNTDRRVNQAALDRLWDDLGREWTTKYIRWATVKDVKIFLRRRDVVGHIDDCNEVSWMNSDEAKVFWAEVEDSFEVPGSGNPSSGRLPSWGAHIWRHEKERRLVFTMFT
jgi:hypothetical protein